MRKTTQAPAAPARFFDPAIVKGQVSGHADTCERALQYLPSWNA